MYIFGVETVESIAEGAKTDGIESQPVQSKSVDKLEYSVRDAYCKIIGAQNLIIRAHPIPLQYEL